MRISEDNFTRAVHWFCWLRPTHLTTGVITELHIAKANAILKALLRSKFTECSPEISNDKMVDDLEGFQHQQSSKYLGGSLHELNLQ
ncbi:hypothetical protein QE152_g7101 [Popillia japonica]|uniref:Uncharacterized protein n=1 Tax=Popillia japonica TaxID=7064 RepID=A0AAW1MCS9_POPJA